jgi:hypothetical protein
MNLFVKGGHYNLVSKTYRISNTTANGMEILLKILNDFHNQNRMACRDEGEIILIEK